jgi:hypothetical protein
MLHTTHHHTSSQSGREQLDPEKPTIILLGISLSIFLLGIYSVWIFNMKMLTSLGKIHDF